MSKPEWLHTFDSCLTEPNESQLVRATVAFDFRPTSGGLPVAAELSARIRRARDHPRFMRLIARSAAGLPVALGFRGQPSTDETGRLDLKRGAITPLVNVVRYYALAAGVTISSTLDRLAAVGGAGALAEESAEELREAFEVITRIRFEHHAECIAAGRPADNLIDPGALPPIARADLRAALHTVRRAQRRLPV
jgi:CBS domain-containing protein